MKDLCLRSGRDGGPEKSHPQAIFLTRKDIPEIYGKGRKYCLQLSPRLNISLHGLSKHSIAGNP